MSEQKISLPNKVAETNIATTVDTNNVEVTVAETSDSTGFFGNLIKKFTDNKLYIYIGISVLVLAFVLYYFYIKNKKETTTINNNKIVVSQPVTDPNFVQIPKNLLNPGDYFMVDPSGRPVKVSNNLPTHNQHQLPQPDNNLDMRTPQMKMFDNLQLQPSMMKQVQKPDLLNSHQTTDKTVQSLNSMNLNNIKKQIQVPVEKPKPKIKHPNEDDDIVIPNINSKSETESDASSESDINDQISRIQANEDDNVAQHNLTNSELDEINKKLAMMNTMNN